METTRFCRYPDFLVSDLAAEDNLTLIRENNGHHGARHLDVKVCRVFIKLVFPSSDNSIYPIAVFIVLQAPTRRRMGSPQNKGKATSTGDSLRLITAICEERALTYTGTAFLQPADSLSHIQEIPMQRRVLIILLGMVIASLASACGQKGPLFLPEGTDDNVTAYATHYANDGPDCEQVGVTHAGSLSTASLNTGSSSTASPSTQTMVSAHMLRPALATTLSMKVSS